MASNAKFNNEIVNKFLRALFCQNSKRNIPFNINIKESANTAERHSSAVLFFNGGKVSKVSPLNCLSCVGCGLTNIKAVHFSHISHIAKEGYLLKKFFVKTNNIGIKNFFCKVSLVLFLFFDKFINSVKRNSSVIANNSAPTVSVG